MPTRRVYKSPVKAYSIAQQQLPMKKPTVPAQKVMTEEVQQQLSQPHVMVVKSEASPASSVFSCRGRTAFPQEQQTQQHSEISSDSKQPQKLRVKRKAASSNPAAFANLLRDDLSLEGENFFCTNLPPKISKEVQMQKKAEKTRKKPTKNKSGTGDLCVIDEIDEPGHNTGKHFRQNQQSATQSKTGTNRSKKAALNKSSSSNKANNNKLAASSFAIRKSHMLSPAKTMDRGHQSQLKKITTTIAPEIQDPFSLAPSQNARSRDEESRKR